MSNQRVKLVWLPVAAFIAVLLWGSSVTAVSPQSSNYRFDEGVIGTGGLLEASSSNFTATSATGDIAIGNSASTNFQVDSGTKTSPDPALTFIVTTGNVGFTSFSPTATATASTTFSVINYTTWGYVVQLIGEAPANGAHQIDAMTVTDAPQIGIEQFGLNLVANTLPASLGANPNNGQFGFGVAAANYATPNEYRFVSGETIASAPKNSGETTYTISYIINVGALTPGGQYTGKQSLIVTGTY